MHKFAEFDQKLKIARLPLTYSLGDLSTIREIFTPEPGDVGRTQLPILPPTVEAILVDGSERRGYLVEVSPALLVGIKEFLKGIIAIIESKQLAGPNRFGKMTDHYGEIRRECMNRIGIRLIEVIKRERRLGLYNLFWLMISKHIVSLLDQVIPAQGTKQSQYKIVIQPLIAQAFLETLQKVRVYLDKEDEKQRRYSPYINETLTSHLGATFNHEFARAIITDQIHLLFPPNSSRNVFWECAQAVFIEGNEKYHITSAEFSEIYAGVRSYIEGRLRRGDLVFRDLIANVLKIPPQTVASVPIETIVFHPTIILLLAEEIKQLPLKTAKKAFFKGKSPLLGNLLGDGSWEFAMNDYVTFAKDLRRSEVIAFFRNRIVFVTKTQEAFSGGFIRGVAVKGTSRGIAEKISYQFDKGRIIHDLRSVTLIFLDLRGFTELSAGDITDQELKEQLYNFFDPVVNIINHFGGSIRNYAGDSILASFGTERRQKNHVLDAVRAAIEIQKFFNLLKQEGQTVFQGMGIGIHTGLVEEAYFFLDPETPDYHTVIGLAVNLVGRLSSGKAEKKQKLDLQAAFSLQESLISTTNMDSALLVNIENQLMQALDALQHEQAQPAENQTPSPGLTVKVVQGILNNQGIAISGVENGAFEKIRASVELKEIEVQKRIQYTFFDDVLHEQIVFIKAGDASFKGIDTNTRGKVPVWGVYLERDLPGNPPLPLPGRE